MSRHNRRRTRGGHKSKGLALHSESTMDAYAFASDGVFAPPPTALPAASARAATAPSARHWHSRYMAWQARERRQRDEAAALEAAKQRIFGEADGSGDDESLCVKMLEYFGGLDFIDP